MGRYFNVESSSAGNFKDIEPGSYYEKFANWAIENKIINGYDDNTFKPYKEISREEVAVIMDRISEKLTVKEKNSTLNINDLKDEKDISPWALESVNKALKKAWLKGDINNNYNPLGNLTRAEFAQVIYNIDR